MQYIHTSRPIVSLDARPAGSKSFAVNVKATPYAGDTGAGRTGEEGAVARYDCFAVILYWINGAGNNRARHNARMGRRPCRPGGTRTGFSVRRMWRGGGRHRRSSPGVRRRTR